MAPNMDTVMFLWHQGQDTWHESAVPWIECVPHSTRWKGDGQKRQGVGHHKSSPDPRQGAHGAKGNQILHEARDQREHHPPRAGDHDEVLVPVDRPQPATYQNECALSEPVLSV
jgi:hypothetical protein